MRLSIQLTALALALGGAVNAAAQTWPIDDEHGFPTALSDLPALSQQVILAGLEPALVRLGKEWYIHSAEIAAVKDDLQVLEVPTVSGKLYFVQGFGMYLCGMAAGGNCTFWVVGDHSRLLLTGRASEVTLLKSSQHGKPSIRSSLRTSGTDSTLIWYRFDGSLYRMLACAIKSSVGRAPSLPPSIEYIPCKRALK